MVHKSNTKCGYKANNTNIKIETTVLQVAFNPTNSMVHKNLEYNEAMSSACVH